MARKCSDGKALTDIMATSDPAIQKSASRKIRKLTALWKEVEYKTMEDAVRAKFDQNPHLRDFLVNTGTTRLAEASATDRKWGIGYGFNDDDRTKQDLWGDSKLGDILQKVRDEMR